MNMSSEENLELNLSDSLALERTKLAKERTYLAYFRTFVVFVSSGWAIVRLEFFHDIRTIGYTFIIFSVIILLAGITSYILMKKRLKKYYKKQSNRK